MAPTASVEMCAKEERVAAVHAFVRAVMANQSLASV